MSRTYSATGNRYSLTGLTNAVGAASSATLFAGWFLPTTLTAGRGYWSAGTITGIEVGTTTSEVIGRIQSLTNGVYTSSGAGIAVGNWYFIAHYLDATNTGPNSVHKLWVGKIDSPPREVTFTQTTQPVGAFTSATIVTFGNKGNAGNVAFQGDVGNCFFATQSTNTGGPFNLLSYGPGGKGVAEIANESAGLLNNFILPWWSGETFPQRGRDYSFSATTADRFTMYAFLSDFDGAVSQTTALSFQSGVGTSVLTPTSSGTAVSRNRTPRGGVGSSLPFLIRH